MTSFSDRLRLARERAGYTQKALARASGVSQSSIASYERGHRRSSRSARSLAKVLQVEAEWLETGRGPMKKADPYPADTGPAEAHLLLEEGRTYWPFSVSPGQVQNLGAEQLRALDAIMRAYIENLAGPDKDC